MRIESVLNNLASETVWCMAHRHRKCAWGRGSLILILQKPVRGDILAHGVCKQRGQSDIWFLTLPCKAFSIIIASFTFFSTLHLHYIPTCVLTRPLLCWNLTNSSRSSKPLHPPKSLYWSPTQWSLLLLALQTLKLYLSGDALGILLLKSP